MGCERDHRIRSCAAALLGGVSLGSLAAQAQDATWKAVPVHNDWNTGSNWTPAVTPTGTAMFGASNITALTFSAATTSIGAIQFDSGAPVYRFTIAGFGRDVNVTGVGVVNNSTFAPLIEVRGTEPTGDGLTRLLFRNASSAGNASITTNGGFFGGFDSNRSNANGILAFFDSSNAGNATIANQTGATDFFNNSSAGNSRISNGPSLARTYFHDTSTAANATITNNAISSLYFLDFSTAGSASILNKDGGSTTFFDGSNAGTATIRNVMTGSSFSLVAVTGFVGTSSAGSADISNSGASASTQFAVSSTAGAATITTSNFARVTFSGNSTGGSARLITNGTGIADFSATRGPAGDGSVTVGSIEGSGTYRLGAVRLTVGVNDLSSEVSGLISDGGIVAATGASLVKVGAGTLSLSGTNTYTGPTTVNAGTLIVNSTIASSSSLTVNSGATVGGIGTLPSTTVNGGGSLSPGNSIGAINISGNLVLGAGSVYVVEVSPASADRTNVSGTATLGGTVHAIFGPGGYTSNSYTILSAVGGRSGTFDALTTSGLPATLSASLSYTSTDVLLVTLTSQIAPTLGNTYNQRQVAGAQDKAFNAGLPNISALYGLTLAQLPAALDQLSGEVHASTAGVLVDDSLYVRSAVLGRLRQASYGGNASMASLAMGGPQTAFADEAAERIDGALAYAKSAVAKAPMKTREASRDIVFWAHGFGAWGRFDGDGNAASVRRDLAGFISGVDMRVGETGRAGIAAGYTGSRNNLGGRGTANVETGHIAGYGGWSFGNINLRAGGAYAFHALDTDRTVAFPGFADGLTARYDGGTGQVFGEVGYGFAFANVAIEPFAGGAWVRLDTDGTVERGGVAALNVAANSFEVGYSTLGIRAASMIPLGHDMVLMPRASLAWQHAFDGVTHASRQAFQINAVPFIIAGVPIARDSLLAEVGLDLAIGRNAAFGVSYIGQIASNVADHAAKGKFSWRF